MNYQKLFLILPLLLIPYILSSQGFLITSPKLEFDGTQLMIYYDIVSNNKDDQYFVWIEIQKKNGEPVRLQTLSGDIGDIKDGKNKMITWEPEKDSIFLDEEVLVEIKAEKYVKSFNKGSMILISTVLPGLGQTNISKGKPYWLTGIVSYGALVGGFIEHKNYLKTYNSYLIEEDPSKRADLFTQSQKKLNISRTLIASGAAIWAANILWVALIPVKYRPLQHAKLSIDQLTGPYKGTKLLTLKLNF